MRRAHIARLQSEVTQLHKEWPEMQRLTFSGGGTRFMAGSTQVKQVSEGLHQDIEGCSEPQSDVQIAKVEKLVNRDQLVFLLGSIVQGERIECEQPLPGLRFIVGPLANSCFPTRTITELDGRRVSRRLSPWAVRAFDDDRANSENASPLVSCNGVSKCPPT